MMQMPVALGMDLCILCPVSTNDSPHPGVPLSFLDYGMAGRDTCVHARQLMLVVTANKVLLYLKLNCRKNAVEQTEAGGINKCSKEV